jgi:hypothetical protein
MDSVVLLLAKNQLASHQGATRLRRVLGARFEGAAATPAVLFVNQAHIPEGCRTRSRRSESRIACWRAQRHSLEC